MKIKFFAIIISIIIMFSSFGILSNAQEILLGDLNRDGKVSASDARTVLRFSAKLENFTEDDIVYADVNFDNNITAKDARLILRAAAKLESLPELSTNETTENNNSEQSGTGNYNGHVYTGGSSSKKYHYEPECAGKYSHEISWNEVKSRGLGPCKTCVLN